MNIIYLFFILLLGVHIKTKKCESENIGFEFPEDFLIGTASSSYQIEGAWNISGKAKSNWDHFVHNYPEKILDKSTGDMACDSYHKYKEDTKLMKNIGFNRYRFSLSWSRILPTGEIDYVNKVGLRYYHNVLDELEKHDIIPFVTIYHWDHPQSLDSIGGWLNETMAYKFADYAKVIFTEFGHRVKYFLTLNEPYNYCRLAYSLVDYPPAINASGWGEYQCVQNMLKAHALAYHIYDEEFRDKQNGKIGAGISSTYSYSKDKNDYISRDIAFEFHMGWMANPIFSKKGDYPDIMKHRIAERSSLQGFNHSRLPTLSEHWIEYIKGTADYFGLNHYTSDIVTPLPHTQMLTWPNDEGLEHSHDPNWQTAEVSWHKVVPEGLRLALNQIKDKYDNPPVYILENGVADGNGTNDVLRINYLHSYMKEMLIAMKQDGCNVKAYTVWSFLDNFEWNQGYTKHFGLVEVDFKNENRKRTPKKSASWLKRVLETRKLQDPDVIQSV